METIKIKELEQSPTQWGFSVSIGEKDDANSVKKVTLEKKYWQHLTGGNIEPTDLIERSFQFLLERETKESILKEFNLSVINQYFTEYEETIQKEIA